MRLRLRIQSGRRLRRRLDARDGRVDASADGRRSAADVVLIHAEGKAQLAAGGELTKREGERLASLNVSRLFGGE